MRTCACIVAFLFAVTVLSVVPEAGAQVVTPAVKHDVSPALSSVPPPPPTRPRQEDSSVKRSAPLAAKQAAVADTALDDVHRAAAHQPIDVLGGRRSLPGTPPRLPADTTAPSHHAYLHWSNVVVPLRQGPKTSSSCRGRRSSGGVRGIARVQRRDPIVLFDGGSTVGPVAVRGERFAVSAVHRGSTTADATGTSNPATSSKTVSRLPQVRYLARRDNASFTVRPTASWARNLRVRARKELAARRRE